MNDNLPLVSVLLPVKNGGVHFETALNSLLKQSYSNLEIIIVDDHSTDGALRHPLCRDNRVRLFVNPGHGIVSALNTAANQARGQIFARMDADDIALPTRIEEQVGLLKSRPEIGICGTKVEIFSDAGMPGAGFRYYQNWLNRLTEPGEIAREIFVESPIPHPSAMFWRQTFVELGGYRESAWPEDYDLWLRAFRANKKMAKPEPVLLRWRDSAARLSRTSTRYSEAQFQQAKAHFLATTVTVERVLHIWGAGPTGRSLYDRLIENACAISGFIDVHPRRIGGTKRGLPVREPGFVRQLDQELVLVAVGARGAREEIRDFMRGCDKQEGSDFLFVA